MQLKLCHLVIATLVAGSTPLFAGPPNLYPYPGTIAPGETLKATSTAVDVEYFYGANAADTDLVNIIDVTNGTSTGWQFDNQTSTPGVTQLSLSVSQGDTVVVGLENTLYPDFFYSGTGAAPAGFTASADGLNHAYMAPFAGGMLNGVQMPAGVYVGMEDLDAAQNSDWDYNDDQLVLTGVSVSAATPEPSSIALLGTGLLGAAGAFRRRFFAA